MSPIRAEYRRARIHQSPDKWEDDAALLRDDPVERSAAALEEPMLHYAVVFFVIALIASVLGLNGLAGLSAQVGWLFAILAVAFLVVALLSGRGGRNLTIP